MTTIRMLAYVDSLDLFDEYLQILKRTSRESLQHFTRCVIDLYSNVYMREPTKDDIHRLYSKHDSFPGMLGSIDCMHWAWGKVQINENVNSHEAITVTRQSCWKPLYRMKTEFCMHILEWQGYYLADWIYSSWASFVKGYSSVTDPKRTYFTKKQSVARKDIERAFGILQDNGFNIAENKSYYMPVNNLQGSTWYERCDVYLEKIKELRDKDEHEYLRHTLVSHLWHNREIV
ncbi:uncharacterized protein [Rutidosis leptorrhynchoides]|uniref:uncharacterized protein n=1 Tax=Rutidosis leptorrhynchoides TaxID=125765 RepID=UPI003A9908D2